jgi:7 transmembrane sweet-taste receptor of 3 GCPR
VQSSSELRELVFEDVLEPPQTLGALGLESWFITKFTLETNPQFAIYLGLHGEENRQALADTFLRPTTWYDYCTQVSTNNCTIPNNVTHRPPLTMEERLQYHSEGNYIGHFRATDDNNCTLSPTTCTGHIADFPCDWDSYVQPQLKYLNIPLKSSGPELPIGGYPYVRLVELWKAANATKSNLIMHYWTPEPLVQEFIGTDSEFVRVTMPPASQLCQETRREELNQCSYNETELYGSPDGVCEESVKNLYKIIVGNLFDAIYNDPKVSDPIRSPAYDAIRLFQLSELQMGEIFDYYHKSKTIHDGTVTSARDAVCLWVVENLDFMKTFVPRTFPRKKNSSSKSQTSNAKIVSIVTIVSGCIATLLVLVMSYLVYSNKSLRAIRLAQVEFLYLLLGGLLLVAIGSILVGLQPSNKTCVTIIWFINIGYTLEFVPLIVKVAAVNKLVGSGRRFRRVVLSRKSLFSAVFGISSLVFVVLMIWTIIDPPTRNNNYVLTDIVNDDGYTIVDVTHYCSSDSDMWDYFAVGWNTLLLLCATVLAFQTRTLQKDFNESQTLAFLIYSHFVFVVLRFAAVILQKWNGVTSEKLVGLRSFIFSIDTIATIIIYFVPKFTAAANKAEVDRSSSNSIAFDGFSSTLRHAGGPHFRADNHREDSTSMTTTEATNRAHFECSHTSTASIDTMKQSNRGSHVTVNADEQVEHPESIDDSDAADFPRRPISELLSTTSQQTDDDVENDEFVRIPAMSNDTLTGCNVSTDDTAKCRTIFVGDMDEAVAISHLPEDEMR